ncbi:MAG: aspartate aminotransferase family protein [Actinomycetota bacterium]
MSNVFSRGSGDLPVAVRGEGVWITDADGKRYLDAAGGALVVNVGHGDHGIAWAMAEQAERLSYVHATAFTTEVLESYAVELAPLVPVDGARVYPVSGGSEAVETAFKLARAYHLARGEPDRSVIVARWGSYHGNTLGALDASGREPLRAPYEPWLGRVVHMPAVHEYRCELKDHPDRCAEIHADALETFVSQSPETVAAFIAEPIGGATLGASVPPDGYWGAIREVCDRYGVLLVADEVMTGFGRTGAWFGLDHWGIRADIVVAGKGASSGYWPLGLCIAVEQVHDAAREGGFVHGFTASHHAVGAAVGSAVLRRLREEHLVEASRTKGELLLKDLQGAIGDHPHVGDIRGRGLMIGVELVEDRDTKAPFARERRITEGLTRAAKERGLLLYPSTGCADGERGDLVMLGPPFVINDEELQEIVARLSAALEDVF